VALLSIVEVVEGGAVLLEGEEVDLVADSLEVVSVIESVVLTRGVELVIAGSLELLSDVVVTTRSELVCESIVVVAWLAVVLDWTGMLVDLPCDVID
jgi:hypothetical protein